MERRANGSSITLHDPASYACDESADRQELLDFDVAHLQSERMAMVVDAEDEEDLVVGEHHEAGVGVVVSDVVDPMEDVVVANEMAGGMVDGVEEIRALNIVKFGPVVLEFPVELSEPGTLMEEEGS